MATGAARFIVGEPRSTRPRVRSCSSPTRRPPLGGLHGPEHDHHGDGRARGRGFTPSEWEFNFAPSPQPAAATSTQAMELIHEGLEAPSQRREPAVQPGLLQDPRRRLRRGRAHLTAALQLDPRIAKWAATTAISTASATAPTSHRSESAGGDQFGGHAVTGHHGTLHEARQHRGLGACIVDAAVGLGQRRPPAGQLARSEDEVAARVDDPGDPRHGAPNIARTVSSSSPTAGGRQARQPHRRAGARPAIPRVRASRR